MSRIFLTVSAILSVIVLGILFWGLVSGKEQPPAASGAALVSVQVPALEGDALAGETLFRENCASCHGDNAAGRDGIAPPLVHKIYEPGHHADGAFLLAVSRGVRAHHWPFGDMPPVDGVSRRMYKRSLPMCARFNGQTGSTELERRGASFEPGGVCWPRLSRHLSEPVMEEG